MTAESKEEPTTNEETKEADPMATELDLGLGAPETEEEEVGTELDYEAAYSTLKPDFATVAKLMELQPKAENQDELASKLVEFQTQYETFLKETLVPKIKAAVGLAGAKPEKKAQAKQKPGVPSAIQPKERKRITPPRQGLK